MRTRAALTFLLVIAAGLSLHCKSSESAASLEESKSLAGMWMGDLDVGMATLRLVMNLEETASGDLVATLDSPDQGARGIPVQSVTANDSIFVLDIPIIGARYEGRFDEVSENIVGRWAQAGNSLPLTLTRTNEAPVSRRPQEPKPPYPYDVEEVRIENAADSVVLAATLTLPRSDGPHPAAILISGSGPQDRDEALFNHRPFLVIADYLTRRGIAVLRYDDRGFAGSTGDFQSATTVDFANDARAALEWMRQHPAIDPGRVGLIGHSEGGLVAPLAAQASAGHVAYLVLLAAPGVRGEEILYEQDSLMASASGADSMSIALSRERKDEIFAVIKAEPDAARAEEQLRSVMRSMELTDQERIEMQAAGQSVDALIEQQIAQLNTPWFRFFLTHEPLPVLRALDVPVLSLVGEKDLQVPHYQNHPHIQEVLRQSGNPKSEARVLAGLNHLFQTAETGLVAEYPRIEETFAPWALEIMADWILDSALAGTD